jgi:hypothetical protein
VKKKKQEKRKEKASKSETVKVRKKLERAGECEKVKKE